MDELSEIAGLPRGAALAGFNEARPIAVTAPDGVTLAAQSWGDPAKPAILFIHGFGQCHLSWLRQVRSDLAQDFHLITYDLRGHGESDKPLDPARYAEPQTWADDVESVLAAAGAERAVLVAWSFGGRVALDYLAAYPQGRAAGLNLVGSSISEEPGLRGMGSARLRPLFCHGDLSLNIAATREFLHRCFRVLPDPLTFQEMLAYNMVVPPAVRLLLLGRPPQPESALRQMHLPVLVTYGAHDALATLQGAEYAATVFPNGTLSLYPESGHSPFFEEPARFNRELRDFARSVAAGPPIPR